MSKFDHLMARIAKWLRPSADSSTAQRLPSNRFRTRKSYISQFQSFEISDLPSVFGRKYTAVYKMPSGDRREGAIIVSDITPRTDGTAGIDAYCADDCGFHHIWTKRILSLSSHKGELLQDPTAHFLDLTYPVSRKKCFGHMDLLSDNPPQLFSGVDDFFLTKKQIRGHKLCQDGAKILTYLGRAMPDFSVATQIELKKYIVARLTQRENRINDHSEFQFTYFRHLKVTKEDFMYAVNNTNSNKTNLNLVRRHAENIESEVKLLPPHFSEAKALLDSVSLEQPNHSKRSILTKHNQSN